VRQTCRFALAFLTSRFWIHCAGLTNCPFSPIRKDVKTTLRLIALALVIGAVAYWAAAGANRGWTKTSVPIKTVDEVTGIEGVTYQKKFVPGVDFLAVAIGCAVLCAGVSFLFRTKRNDQTSNQPTINS
jgi:hypothetical protein